MKKLIEVFIVLAFSLFTVTAQAVETEVCADNCTLEQGLDAPALVWETGGNADWFCQNLEYYYGGSAAQSGMIEATETSWLETTVTVEEDKVVSFYWKLQPPPQLRLDSISAGDCPPQQGSLSFYIDGSKEAEVNRPRDWRQVILCLPPGTHTLRWEFSKAEGQASDEPEVGGGDCSPRIGLVDYVQIIDPPGVNLFKHYIATYPQQCSVEPQFAKNRVAKAEADECYEHGYGSTGMPIGPDNCTEGEPKTNQAYVWSLTRSGNLWFGTIANPPCLMIGAMGMGETLETSNLVCTGEDWRPPQIFEYDPLTMTVTERTPMGMMDPDNATLGIRSAGALDGVVLMAGPSLDGERINMFAFLDDGTYLGMHVMEAYDDIRNEWIVYNGSMYVGVRTVEGGEGRILRWTGNSSDPFQFEVVGVIDLMAANMTVHRGRLFVTTWPYPDSMHEVGMWRSPVIGDGLENSDNASWEKVWQVSDYEPDPIMQRVYAGGALASLDGNLYWGTMHVPYMGTMAALTAADMGIIDISGVNGEIGQDDITALALGTHRATSVFSSTFETGNSTVELLYGDEYLPVYDNATRSYTIAYDDMHRNNMGVAPKWGPAGICSYFNAYTWSMERAFADYPGRGGLALGTFDSSFLARDMAGALLEDLMPDCFDCGESMLDLFLGVLDELYNQHGGGYGADLYVIRSVDEPFILDSKDGAGNYFNYGIRTMQMPDEDATPDVPDGPDFMGEETCPQGYLGMANPFNLNTEGGWELIQVHPMPELALVSPIPGQFVNGLLTLQAQDLSICPLVGVEFVITDVDGQSTVYGPATDAGAGLWEYPLDTAALANGIYYAMARGSDADGGEAASEQVPFAVVNECTQDSDCDDGLFCTGNETCVQGLCESGTNPCGEGADCDEVNNTCSELPPAAICDNLTAGRGKKGLPLVSHPTKDKKTTLTVTGLEGVDITGEFDLGPFGFVRGKAKYKKGVLKVKVIVPAGLASDDYEIMIGGCTAAVTVVTKEELKAFKAALKAANN